MSSVLWPNVLKFLIIEPMRLFRDRSCQIENTVKFHLTPKTLSVTKTLLKRITSALQFADTYP